MRVAAALAMMALSAADPLPPDAYRADARSIAPLIAANYAYLDHLPGGVVPSSPQLDAERDAVHDRDSLLHYAEDMMTALADHHAITGASFKDDWAIVPSYADLWIDEGYRITAVKAGSPAARAGIVPGEMLTQVGGTPIGSAVASFWAVLGLPPVGERQAYAARVLAAGRRDRPRVLTVRGAGGQVRTLTLAGLYDAPDPASPVSREGDVIRLDNSLGDQATIAAFDAAMAQVPDRAAVTIDLTDTPSGGNTSVARAIMGWFVTKPMPYQMHQLPAEERETGIPRQWLEEVLPRAGKHHDGPVRVRVGRWTGSMGEGLAIGLAATAHAKVCGGPMAGLKGAVYDFPLERSGLVVKFPAERLFTVGGQPREMVTPPC